MGKIRPRKHDRVRHLREVAFRVAPDGPPCRGHTIDLSPSGVRLYSDQSLPLGESIDLTWSDRVPPVTVGGRVVHVKVEVEGNCAGIRFHRPIDPAEYQTLREAPVR